MTDVTTFPALTVSGIPVGNDAIVDSGVCWAIMVDTPNVQGESPFIQIFNPNTNTKRLYVDMAIARCITQHEVGLVINSSALGSIATDVQPYNMKNGSQNGCTAQIRVGAQSAQILYPFVDVQEAGPQADSMVFRKFEQPYPIILDPGHGAIITDYAIGCTLLGGFYWREY